MRRLLSAALLLLTVFCTGCGAAPARPAAEPPVLTGAFAGPGGTLAFSSDGVSVTMTLTAEFAAATDGDTVAFFLPEGESVQFKRQ